MSRRVKGVKFWCEPQRVPSVTYRSSKTETSGPGSRSPIFTRWRREKDGQGWSRSE